jgi:hypothetical protein
MATIAEFKREYTRAISEGYAAVFAGTGLSRSAGFVDWKSLVRPFANEIRLSVDKESDLLFLTQFYANERGNRASINQKILNEFTKSTADNENISIITRIPIDTYWTTNYDRLLEQGLEANNRNLMLRRRNHLWRTTYLTAMPLCKNARRCVLSRKCRVNKR